MHLRFVLSVLFISLSGAAHAYEDLASLDLEQLMDMNVTTVARREQTFHSATAALFTLSQDDIRRSGATSLPELLRLAPGMEVAQINPSMWAVSARGFNSQFANKLLVMIDGRSIYTPLFSGVYWDTQMPPLEEIQRIEIIRGPGASLWGANAVNGVINIITYDSERTLDTRIVAGLGNEERGFLRAREGFSTGRLTGRVNVQQRRVDEGWRPDTEHATQDDYAASQFGMRLDWRPRPSDKLTLDTATVATDKHLDIDVPPGLAPLAMQRRDVEARHHYLQLNWLSELPNQDALFMQAYADRDHRDDALYHVTRSTIDIGLQYNHQQTDLQRLTWGISHRRTQDEILGSFVVFAENPQESYSLYTAFLQDEIRVSDEIDMIMGIRADGNGENQTELQPSWRLAWQPDDSTTWWLAISRAARTPSRLETSLEFRSQNFVPTQTYLATLFPAMTGYTVIRGSEDFGSERVTAYEGGWRWHSGACWLVDVSLFVNDYDRLRTYVITEPIEVDMHYADAGYVGLIGSVENASTARTSGLEMAVNYRLSAQWRLQSSYSHFDFDAGENPVNSAYSGGGFALQSPSHQARISSFYSLGNQWEFDVTLRYVDETFAGRIPTYTDLTARLGRAITPNVEVSLVGKHLLDRQHPEFYDTNYGPVLTEMQRSAFIQLDWRSL